MSRESIEEKLGITYTSNESIETRINLKINKNANKDDSDAYAMLEYLKDKNINLSKHIRLLLALEYRGEIILPDKHQVVDSNYTFNNNRDYVDNNPIAVTVEEDYEILIPPSDDDL